MQLKCKVNHCSILEDTEDLREQSGYCFECLIAFDEREALYNQHLAYEASKPQIRICGCKAKSTFICDLCGMCLFCHEEFHCNTKKLSYLPSKFYVSLPLWFQYTFNFERVS